MDTSPSLVADPLQTQREPPGQWDARETQASAGEGATQGLDTDEEIQNTAGDQMEVECGCISATQDHLEDLRTWRQDINDALSKLPAIDVQYTTVVVLMVYWARSDVEYLKTNANILHRVFQKKYGYTVETHVLNNELDSKKDDYDIFKDFKKQLDAMIEMVDKKDQSNLFILYYAGHGATLDGKKPMDTTAPFVWQPTLTAPSHRLQFRQCQPILMNTHADILFIFDCCYALAMIEESEFQIWPQRCEIICSSSALEKASALKGSSFTKALAEELDTRCEQRGQGASWYYTLLTSTERTRHHKLVQAPLWRRYSSLSFRTGIFLQSRHWKPPKISAVDLATETDSGVGSSTASITSQGKLYKQTIDELTSLSDARVLVKIRLRNPAEQFLTQDWLEMFEHRPANIDTIEVNIVDKVVCHALFESDSSLLLVTVPIWLWQTVEHNPAYENLGTVRSDNLLAPNRPVRMKKVATALASSAKSKATTSPMDNKQQPMLETVSAKELATILIQAGIVEREAPRFPAHMNPKTIEEEEEDFNRGLEQALSECKLLLVKEEKIRELEQRVTTADERSKIVEQGNIDIEEQSKILEKRSNAVKETSLGLERENRAAEDEFVRLNLRIQDLKELTRTHEEEIRRIRLHQSKEQQDMKNREKEISERSKALQARERAHAEAVRATERRLVERERDIEHRDRQQRSPPGSAYLAAVNDMVSSDQSTWRALGNLVKNFSNEGFLGLAERTTKDVGRRQEQRILTGRA